VLDNAVFDEPVKQAGELASHGGLLPIVLLADSARFRFVKRNSPPGVKSAQIAGTEPPSQCRGSETTGATLTIGQGAPL
jgi:hypothetical protein